MTSSINPVVIPTAPRGLCHLNLNVLFVALAGGWVGSWNHEKVPPVRKCLMMHPVIPTVILTFEKITPCRALKQASVLLFIKANR